jgi:hypothetical protein
MRAKRCLTTFMTKEGSTGASCTDGAFSAGSLVGGGDGNVYGVTNEGHLHGPGPNG